MNRTTRAAWAACLFVLLLALPAFGQEAIPETAEGLGALGGLLIGLIPTLMAWLRASGLLNKLPGIVLQIVDVVAANWGATANARR